MLRIVIVIIIALAAYEHNRKPKTIKQPSAITFVKPPNECGVWR
jgi:hypothetical protein